MLPMLQLPLRFKLLTISYGCGAAWSLDMCIIPYSSPTRRYGALQETTC
jgi:hypothetical protein